MKNFEDKYIELILNRCFNFNQSRSLLIHIDLKEHLDFATKLKEKAFEMGINDVFIHIEDLDDIHQYLKEENVDNILTSSFIDRSVWDEYAIKGASLLFFISPVIGLMDDISIDKINNLVIRRNETSPYYRKNVSKYLFSWCVCALPNERWAKYVFPNDYNACDKLYMNIMKMCMIDKDNPVKAWQEWINKNNYYKDRLNKLKITGMHYKNSLGTDLYVEKPKDNIWLNLDKSDAFGNPIISNMPSYEIFTTPDYRKTEGIVYSSKPLFYNGICIDEFYIEFEHGKAVNAKALQGDRAIKSLIKADKYISYLGEIALVPYDSPISNTNIVFNETLFDENASCHLALGRGFYKTVPNYLNKTDENLYKNGLNLGVNHVDFMIGTNDLEIEADTNEGKKLIFKNGNFNL